MLRRASPLATQSALLPLIVAVESGSNPDCPHAGVAAAFDVDLLVTDKKRTRQIDLVLLRGLQNHSRRWLAVTGMLTRNVGAKISCIDQAMTQLARNFRFNGAIFVNVEKAATDAALVRNNDEFESF